MTKFDVELSTPSYSVYHITSSLAFRMYLIVLVQSKRYLDYQFLKEASGILYV